MESELFEDATVSKMEIVQQEEKRQVEHYSLDAVISVGYRVNSKRETHFMLWFKIKFIMRLRSVQRQKLFIMEQIIHSDFGEMVKEVLGKKLKENELSI